MITFANAASVLFGVWVVFSFGLAPLIGRMMTERRRHAKVRVVRTRPTVAKPLVVRHIRARGVAHPAFQAA